MLKNRGITFKLIFFILSSCVAVFVLVLGYDYLISHRYISNHVNEKAKNLTNITVSKIDAVLQAVEEIPETISYFLENSHYDEESLKKILQAVVKNNTKISGAAIAFEPYMFSKNKLYFAPYYYKGEKDVKFTYLGDKSYDYFKEDWYKDAKDQGSPVWSEPYHGRVDRSKVMATYSVPFYKNINNKKTFMGVVTADLSLTWLQKIISTIKIGETGYGFLVSKKGRFITHPHKIFIMNKTMFDVARDRENERLHEIAENMTKGKADHLSYKKLINDEDGWLMYAPLPSSGWSLGIDFPREEMISDLVRLDEMIIILVLVGISLLFIVIYLISRSITRSLRMLAEKTKDIAGGNLDFEPLPIMSHDEVGMLANSFIYMRDSLKKYINELTETTAAKERMESELKIAHNIQASILPRVLPPFTARTDFEIFAALEPAKEVGGDFYDFFFVDDSHLCLVIGDVSGKGVPAALFMAVIKTFIKSVAKEGLSPKAILERANKEACYNNEACFFITVFCGIFNIKTGEIVYTNAGHLPPLLINKNGVVDFLETVHGTAVGAVEKSKYVEEKIILEPGEALFLYTDGVTESFNDKNKMFSEERLINVVFNNRFKSVKMLVEEILRNVKSFSRNVDCSDDITMLSLRYMPEKRAKIDKMETEKTIILKNKLTEIQKLEELILTFGKDNNLTKDVINDINLALEEVFTNAITYGFEDESEHTLEISINLEGSEIFLKVIDDGKAFNPLKVPDPDTKAPLRDRPIGGLGILLTKKSMDQLKYKREKDKNILIMKKFI
jgi:sigma-B regulation protein RsbU (phosphoserine phosphatase)